VRREHGGSYFIGDVVNGVKEGKGIQVFSDHYGISSIYEGDWKNDLTDGRGVYRFPNGNVYEGEFKNGDMDGRGVYRFVSGNIYEGEFQVGKMEGRGVFRFVNGNVIKGEFKEGVLNGRGTVYLTNGEVYDGEFKEDVPIDGTLIKRLNKDDDSNSEAQQPE